MKPEEIKEIAKKLMDPIDKDAVIEVKSTEENLSINIMSSESGRLIGFHGETMESVQYLLRLMVAKVAGVFIPLSVDIDNYKSRKNQELEEFALQVAENVKKSGYAQELRPMNSYERRIIHAILNDFEGIKTDSIGEGELRRVKVEPK